MPASPWRTFGSADPNSDFVALLSYLPLKNYSRVFPFFVYTSQVMKQLATANGLLGYSLFARPLSKRFWTLSAWVNEEALRAFVQCPPHLRIMAALAPHMGETKFVRWTVKGSQLPLQWDEALPRLSGASPSPTSHASNGLQPDCFSLLSGCHCQIGKATVRGCAMPMLDSRSAFNYISLVNDARRLSPFLIVASPFGDQQNLTTGMSVPRLANESRAAAPLACTRTTFAAQSN